MHGIKNKAVQKKSKNKTLNRLFLLFVRLCGN